MLTKIILSLLALQVFAVIIYDLKKENHKGFRRGMDWSLFYLSYLGIVVSYFSIFFPKNVRFWGTENLTDWEAKALLQGQVTIGVFFMIAFWLSVILSKKEGDPFYDKNNSWDIIRKYIAPIGIIATLICLPFFSIIQWQKLNTKNIPVVNNVITDSKKETGIVVQPKMTVDSVSETIIITRGGSLWRDLGMRSRYEMIAFAKKYNLKYWYKKGWLFVRIHTGDKFHKVNNKWEPVK